MNVLLKWLVGIMVLSITGLILFSTTSIQNYSGCENNSKNKRIEVVIDGASKDGFIQKGFFKLESGKKLYFNPDKINVGKIEGKRIFSVGLVSDFDTLIFFESPKVILESMGEAFKEDYFEKQSKMLLTSPEKWVLYVDNFPFEEDIEGTNHQELFKDGGVGKVVYHLRIVSSSLTIR